MAGLSRIGECGLLGLFNHRPVAGPACWGMVSLAMMRFAIFGITACALLIAPAGSLALSATGPDNPPLSVIIDKTIAQADRQQKALDSMQYDQVATVEQLDDRDKTTKHEVLHMIMQPGGHPSMVVTSTQGDNLPTNPDQAQAQGKDVEGNKQNFTLHSLVSRFVITRQADGIIAGQPAYVISFAPKANQPYHDETEKVVNQLQGRMWISQRTFNVLQTEASLAQPVSIAWFVARIPELNFHYSLSADSEAGFSPCQVKITLQVKAFFVGYHVRQTIDMANFRPRAADAQPRG